MLAMAQAVVAAADTPRGTDQAAVILPGTVQAAVILPDTVQAAVLPVAVTTADLPGAVRRLVTLDPCVDFTQKSMTIFMPKQLPAQLITVHLAVLRVEGGLAGTLQYVTRRVTAVRVGAQVTVAPRAVAPRAVAPRAVAPRAVAPREAVPITTAVATPQVVHPAIPTAATIQVPR